MLVVAAVVVGFLVWFIPNFRETKEYKALEQSAIERRERREAREAEQARIDKEREDLGIVYFPPPANPVPPGGVQPPAAD
jgi:hypothetical protein